MTGIEWTDVTWNPVRGCSRVSAGCERCYAERQAARFSGPGQPYERLVSFRSKTTGLRYTNREAAGDSDRPRWSGEIRLVTDKLGEPLRWRKPRRVFVNSMSDLFHPDVPNEFIAAVFGVMAACPQHTFQVLTKRPERAVEWFSWVASPARADPLAVTYGPRLESCYQALRHEMLHHPDGDVGPLHTKRSADPGGPWPLPNVWLGVSAEDQRTADERVPLLLQCPAAVRFVSAEPLLGPIDFRAAWGQSLDGTEWDEVPTRVRPSPLEMLDWVIVGGESGPGARPCHVGWIRDVVRQCREAGVPAFVKQLGANYVDEINGVGGPQARPDPTIVPPIARLTHSKGGDPAEWPEDLRVQEFPPAVATSQDDVQAEAERGAL